MAAKTNTQNYQPRKDPAKCTEHKHGEKSARRGLIMCFEIGCPRAYPGQSAQHRNCKTGRRFMEILEQSCRSARMLSKPTSPAHTHTHSTCVRPFGCSCHVTPEFVLALPLYNSVPCRSYKHRNASKYKLTVPYCTCKKCASRHCAENTAQRRDTMPDSRGHVGRGLGIMERSTFGSSLLTRKP